ncbi:MAG: hypothetical protein GX817_07500 [Elusimicrobia bacterium]|nr:hypothetical protein [Elusimicrobiota bacterium]
MLKTLEKNSRMNFEEWGKEQLIVTAELIEDIRKKRFEPEYSFLLHQKSIYCLMGDVSEIQHAMIQIAISELGGIPVIITPAYFAEGIASFKFLENTGAGIILSLGNLEIKSDIYSSIHNLQIPLLNADSYLTVLSLFNILKGLLLEELPGKTVLIEVTEIDELNKEFPLEEFCRFLSIVEVNLILNESNQNKSKKEYLDGSLKEIYSEKTPANYDLLLQIEKNQDTKSIGYREGIDVTNGCKKDSPLVKLDGKIEEYRLHSLKALIALMMPGIRRN